MKKALGTVAAILTASALTISSYAADYTNIIKISTVGGVYNNAYVTPITTDITATDNFYVGRYNTWLTKDQISELAYLDGRASTAFHFDVDANNTIDYTITLTRQNALLASPTILELNDNGVNLFVYYYPDASRNRFYLIPAQSNAYGACFNFQLSGTALSSGLVNAGISTTANLSLYYENAAGETLGMLQELTKDVTGGVGFNLEYGYTYYIAAGASTLTEEELQTLISQAIKSAIGLTDAELLENPTIKSYVDKAIAAIAATVPNETDITDIVGAYFSNSANLAKLAEDMGFADGADGLSAYQLAVANGYTGTLPEWLASLAGTDGKDGLSAYEIAVANGFKGTEAQWLASLEGTDGASAYELAVANGYKGTEAQWLASLVGNNGSSAYELAVANGYTGTQAQWLTSLTGASGKSAYDLAVANGYTGTQEQWLASLTGDTGKSAYEIAVANGYKGTEAQWLASLTGQDGQSFTEWAIANYGSVDKFIASISGKSAYELAYAKDKTIGTEAQWLASLQGKTGLSAYEVAVTYGGYKGTMAQWLESLQGADGLSAYELAVNNGFKGSLSDWLDSLQGEDGQDGQDGTDGQDGADGQDGRDGADGQNGKDGQVVYINAGSGTGNTTGGTIVAGNTTAGTYNPKTGLAAGIIIPIASLASLIIYKKGKKRRK